MKSIIRVIFIVCIIIFIIVLANKIIKIDNPKRDYEREKLVLSIIEEDRNNYLGQGDEYINKWAPKQAILDEEIEKIFIKYLGEKYFEELKNNISNEMNEKPSEIPESSKILIREAIKIFKGNKITDYERELLKYIFEEVYFEISIEDNQLTNELKSIGIEFE